MVLANATRRCLHMGNDCAPESIASAICGGGVFLIITGWGGIGGGGSGGGCWEGGGVGADTGGILATIAAVAVAEEGAPRDSDDGSWFVRKLGNPSVVEP